MFDKISIHRKMVSIFLSVTSVFCAFTYALADAPGGSGGGDLCEKRIQDIRDDIRQWIRKGGPSKGLKLPEGVLVDQYSERMNQYLAVTKQDNSLLRAVTDIECVHHPIEVQGHEKICRFDLQNENAKITCYYEGFLDKQTMNESEQYRLIHHEYAGLADLESPNGAQSTYPISDQIAGYLRDEVVKKLAVRDPSDVKSGLDRCMNPVDVSLTTNGQVKMRFCEIPAGSADIGSENGESDEKPVKTRNFKSFQMGQFTVTQQQYKVVLGEEPWKKNGQVKSYVQEGDNNPAVYVSYIQAQRFVQVMNLVDPSAIYRLPTEAEFEYAARAGTTTNYYWGDEIDPSYAYYSGNTPGEAYAHSVTSCPVPALDKKYPGYCANNFGLMHMLGNVWQWTADAYVNTYENASTDGNVAVAGKLGSYHVIRGGSWVNPAESLRCSGIRGSDLPGKGYGSEGYGSEGYGSEGYGSEGYGSEGYRLVRMPK